MVSFPCAVIEIIVNKAIVVAGTVQTSTIVLGLATNGYTVAYYWSSDFLATYLMRVAGIQ